MNYRNYKSAMLCVLCIFLIFGITGCKSTSAADGSGGGGSTQTAENYLVTSDGSSPTSVLLETEYNEFLILKGETSRKIYFGGRATSEAILNNVRNYWLQDLAPSKLWDYQDQGASITDKWEEPGVGLYYYGEFYLKEPTQTTIAPESETIQFKVGYYDPQNTIAVIGTKNVDFRYEDSDARNFPVDIYEQTSHNFWNSDVATDVRFAFSSMGVNLLDMYKRSDLTDQTFDYSDSQKFWEYAMKILYPSKDYQDASAEFYASNPTGKGLVFIVQNYFNGPQVTGRNNTLLNSTTGVTWPISTNGSGIFPSFSFVFSEAINDLLSDDWELADKKRTTIHELGHLWCTGFTDNPTHEYWHNGNNKSQCAMLSGNQLIVVDPPDGVPDDAYKKTLAFKNFCEGHLQRGMNVSWNLKQYSPYGEQSGSNMPMVKEYLASLENPVSITNQRKLDIQIQPDQPEYIKGEIFQIDVKITNQDFQPITLQNPSQYYQLNVKHVEDNVEFNIPSMGPVHIWFRDLLPDKCYEFAISPSTQPISYTESGPSHMKFQGYYWKEGTYQVEMVIFGENNQRYSSNITEFTIHTLPSEYEETFELLLTKKRQELDMTIPDILKAISEDRHARFRYELFSLVNYRIPERFSEQPEAFRKALKSLILEKPNKQYIVQYLKDVKRFVNESKDLQAVAANKAFLTEIADSVKTLSAKEPQRYEKLVQVLSGEEEQVFKQ